MRGREAAGQAAAAVGATPTARGRGLNPGKAEPRKPTRPYSPFYRVRPTEHAQRRGRARRGGSACTLLSPGFSGSRGWGQGAGRRTQPRGGVSPFPQPLGWSRCAAGSARTRGPCPPSPARVPSSPASYGFPPSGYRPGMQVSLAETTRGEAYWGGRMWGDDPVKKNKKNVTFAFQARPYTRL